MLPSLVARTIEQGLASYIRNEFPVTPAAGFMGEEGENVLEGFLAKTGAFTKGPWAEVKLPFRKVDEVALPFTNPATVKLFEGFRPYIHQARAFERLYWKHARSTIIATGTGSGKTECFLYPIIDYCLEAQALAEGGASSGHASAFSRPSIKAILVYPMNALTADQSRRIEKLLKEVHAKTGKILRAGIYTGDTKYSTGAADLSATIYLEKDRERIRRNPPDILLTNYRMLDFLLMRPEDQSLWEGNGPGILRYLVVDELHTFDGAQGTDLAVLIRRLKARLNVGEDLACVGTSATIGGKDAVKDLCTYASDVFSAPFTPDDVIEENRLTVEDYLASFGDVEPEGHWPSTDILDANTAASPEEYFSKVVSAWFDDSLGFDGTSPIAEETKKTLGRHLPHLEGFRRLLADLKGVADLKSLAAQWRQLEGIQDVLRDAFLGTDDTERERYLETLIDSLIAMIAMARDPNGRPFLTVRSQLWVRTLSNVVASVKKHPEMKLARDLSSLSDPLHLPVICCSECNHVAWGAFVPGGIHAGRVKVRAELRAFYSAWFTEHQDTTIFYPIERAEEFDLSPEELYRLCPSCGLLTSLASRSRADFERGDAAIYTCSCGCTEAIAVRAPEMTRKGKNEDGTEYLAFHNVCPHCGAEGGLHIFGAAASSLSAAVIDQLHSSAFNNDNKVIAFSDSVQDSALCAGFLNARNFLPTCRHAVAAGLKEKAGNGDSKLRDFLKWLPNYWEQQLQAENTKFPAAEIEKNDCTLIGQAGFLATFIAPDKEWRNAWQVFSDAITASTAQLAKCDKESSAKEKQAATENALNILRTSFEDKKKDATEQWKPLYQDMRERLVWEALMEFGCRSNVGRTLERTCVAVIYPDPEALTKAAKHVAIQLKNTMGATLPLNEIEHLLTGLTNGMRLAGAFSVEDFAKLGYPKLEHAFGEYLKTGNSFRAFNQSAFLPTFHRSVQAPSAITLHAARSSTDSLNVSLLSSNTRKSWFEDWVRRNLPASITAQSQMTDVFLLLMEALQWTALVAPIDRKDDKAWALLMEQWSVSRNVAVWRCTHCGRRFFSGEKKTRRLWSGMKCLSNNCEGTLTEDFDYTDKTKDDTFSAEPARVHAREHTGLISAADRAEIEASFGKTDFPWSINLLAATSTLEMGIDIGDLSTVLLASMPPTQASYLQRIGRAGRRDGNAMAITMVDKRPHDQYFWQSPKEMLEGEVMTPGVFLKAVSVLERQLVAFALGRWVAETLSSRKAEDLSSFDNAILPRHLIEVITAVKAKKRDRFPWNFLTWVDMHADTLAQAFIDMFARPNGTNALTQEGQASLRHFMAGSGEALAMLEKEGLTAFDDLKGAQCDDAPEGEAREAARLGFAARFLSVMQRASAQHEGFQKRYATLRKALVECQKRPKDDLRTANIEEIMQQQDALTELIKKNIQEKSFFNFLTDEGLLPNYAFPEEGVSVNSMVIKRSDHCAQTHAMTAAAPQEPGLFEPEDLPALAAKDLKGQKGVAEKNRKRSGNYSFEFTRPAAQAIHELAPGSRFYANQHILRVDQITLDDQSFEDWRFCSECAHAERVDKTLPPPAKCPHCSNTLFGDIGRVRTMLRTREVTAVADGRYDRIDDRSEERDIKFLVHKVMIDVREKDVTSAWQVKDDRFHFGFEILRRATVREVNFGPAGLRAQSSSFRVAGENYPNTGFQVCRECGKVRRTHYKEGERVHDWGCSWAGKPEDPKNSPWMEGFFLYREVTSEAIRIRIPVCDMLDVAAADSGTLSFIAALRLGLRRHFHGAVDHLAMTLSSDPITSDPTEGGAGGGRNRYVILYDTIPGGSGYLKDLGRVNAQTGRPEGLLELFHEALLAVSGCECAKDPEKDGCYKCVYQYRDASNRALISRREAEEILRAICAFGAERYTAIQSVDAIPPLIASALESRMLKRLSKIPGASLISRPAKDNELVHELSLPISPEAREHWPTELGTPLEGERITWLLRAQVNVPGPKSSRPDFTIEPLSEGLGKRFPQLRSHIFTDGWRYHAGRISDDAEKRQALLNQGARVWTLTWQDLTESTDHTGDEAKAPTAGDVLLRPYGIERAKQLYAKIFAQDSAGDGFAEASALLSAKRSSFDWFIDWLKDPFGFEKSMRIAASFAALTLPRQGVIAADAAGAASEAEAYPCALRLAQALRNEAHILFFEPDSPLPFTFAATLGCDRQTRHCFVTAAIRLEDAPFTRAAQEEGDALRPELQKAWQTFWQSANALQFLERAWVSTHTLEAQGSPYYTQFYVPQKKTIPPSGRAGYSDDTAQWHEFLEELASDADFFKHLLPVAEQLAQAALPAPDDIVDGYSGLVCTDGQGLAWKSTKSDKAGVYLFAQEDLSESVKKNAEALAHMNEAGMEAFIAAPHSQFVVLTTGVNAWEELLERALHYLRA